MPEAETMRLTVVVDQTFHISHYLCIAAMDLLGHGLERLDLITLLVRRGRLRVENKWHGQEPLGAGVKSEHESQNGSAEGTIVHSSGGACSRGQDPRRENTTHFDPFYLASC